MVRVTTWNGTNIIAMPDNSMHNVQQLQTTHNVYHTNSNPKAIQQATQTVQSFPTEARMKAKKKDEMLKAMGHDPKLLRQRKKILQESHYDDCGSDFGGISEVKATKTLKDAIYYCFDQMTYSSQEDSSDAEERPAGALLNQAYLTWMGL